MSSSDASQENYQLVLSESELDIWLLSCPEKRPLTSLLLVCVVVYNLVIIYMTHNSQCINSLRLSAVFAVTLANFSLFQASMFARARVGDILVCLWCRICLKSWKSLHSEEFQT